MFKRIVASLLIAPALAMAADGDSSNQDGPKYLSFEVGTGVQLGRDVWNRGNSYSFAVNIPQKAITLGYYYEQVNATAESNDNNDATSTLVDAKLSIHEIRAIKSIPGTHDMAAIGLGVGMGEFQSNVQGSGISNSQQATVGDVFLKFSPLAGGESFKGALNVIAGYRFVRFSGIDLDNGGTDYTSSTNNLDGLHLGLSAEFGF